MSNAAALQPSVLFSSKPPFGFATSTITGHVTKLVAALELYAWALLWCNHRILMRR
jgi:hypothetical protein